MGRKAEARAAFQRALELKPDYADALEGLRQASG
jgi:Flp pilus assembly protein TadD